MHEDEKLSHANAKLDIYFHMVKTQLLIFQSSTTGLFPRLSSDFEIGVVRDSVYVALCCASLSFAYKRLDDDRGRAYELGQSAVKTMRGILDCWMRQSDKLEQFKANPCAANALHSQFHFITGDEVFDSKDYGHLQIDVVALYLQALVQMISAGLEIIFSPNEVDFVQNLVFYIERAYRTPDYGMWEHGTRYNDNTPELHASSIGMAKAALECLNGFSLYGNRGRAGAVIYVDIDAHNRNRTTFETLLPRESNSKNTDAALIPTISYPCFAIHEDKIISRTMDKCWRKLRGKYGFKRFLRDGIGTVLCDKLRKFYHSGETKSFDQIECQWPIFFAFALIDAVFRNEKDHIQEYRHRLKELVIETNLGEILPQYYYVTSDAIGLEHHSPDVHKRQPFPSPDDAFVFLWGQAVYIIACLFSERLLLKIDIDPIYRHLPAGQRPKFSNRNSQFQGSIKDPVIQLALIAESTRLQAMLATYGIQTQTPHQVEPIQIWGSGELVKVMKALGRNDLLKLSGRPPRPLGVLSTSKAFRVFGETVLCYPLLFEASDFYLSADPAVTIDNIKKDLAFVASRWKLAGRPLVCGLLREEPIRGEQFSQILDLLVSLKSGVCDGVRVRLGRVQNLLSGACIEQLDFVDESFLDDEKINVYRERESREVVYGSLHNLADAVNLDSSDSSFEIEKYMHSSDQDLLSMFYQVPEGALMTQSKILRLLMQRHGSDFTVREPGKEEITIKARLQQLLQTACMSKHWAVVRFCAAVLNKVVDSLAPSVTSILVRGKQLTLGVFGGPETLIDKPMTPAEIAASLFQNMDQQANPSFLVLQQELILAVAQYIVAEPFLFIGILKIRIGWLMHALQLCINFERQDSHKQLCTLSPMQIKLSLHDLLSRRHWNKFTPIQQRQLNGALNRVPPDFYDRVWQILEKTPGGIGVSSDFLPQQPTLSDMTEYELLFALRVEQLLSNIVQPEYRQIVVELFMVVSTILKRNPELSFSGQLKIDKLVRDAYEMFLRDRSSSQNDSNTDISFFYELSPSTQLGTTAYLTKAAVNELFLTNVVSDSHSSVSTDHHCSLS